MYSTLGRSQVRILPGAQTVGNYVPDVAKFHFDWDLTPTAVQAALPKLERHGPKPAAVLPSLPAQERLHIFGALTALAKFPFTLRLGSKASWDSKKFEASSDADHAFRVELRSALVCDCRVRQLLMLRGIDRGDSSQEGIGIGRDPVEPGALHLHLLS